jgi:isopentenyl-diphosphate delta-isomerase
MSDIAKRKGDHLDLTIAGDVGFRSKTTMLDCVHLVHDALPELDVASIDLSAKLFGKRLSAPIVIAAMTGGTDRAKGINETLAGIAEEHGYGIGLGSQRAMLRRPELADTYRVRRVAPNVLLFGNIGVIQAAAMSTAEVEDLVGDVGADALCIHMNPGQEIVQEEGDRDFRGGLDAMGRLTTELSIPVIAKETGCGISGTVARRLASVGVRHVDVSGAGGTSWVAVETERAETERRQLGEAFRDWGIPTAASVALVAQQGFKTIIATGGMKTGLDVARAIVLGAHAGGFARPVLQALDAGGREGAVALLAAAVREIQTAMLLTGARDLAALGRVPRVITEPLDAWMRQASPSPGTLG